MIEVSTTSSWSHPSVDAVASAEAQDARGSAFDEAARIVVDPI